jgi:hypothetical protein
MIVGKPEFVKKITDVRGSVRQLVNFLTATKQQNEDEDI